MSRLEKIQALIKELKTYKEYIQKYNAIKEIKQNNNKEKLIRKKRG